MLQAPQPRIPPHIPTFTTGTTFPPPPPPVEDCVAPMSIFAGRPAAFKAAPPPDVAFNAKFPVDPLTNGSAVRVTSPWLPAQPLLPLLPKALHREAFVGDRLNPTTAVPGLP